jgi:Carbohydrate family 9 binding domain-like
MRQIIFLAFFWMLLVKPVFLVAGNIVGDTLNVVTTTDFEMDGKGSSRQWENASWVALTQLDSGLAGYDTRFKVMYSAKGIYVLFSGKDKKITSAYRNDFDDLYNADVFEVFFHTNPTLPLYFEYEINAYSKELVLLIPNLNNKIMGWLPWHYEGSRKVIKKVDVVKGKNGMEAWTAECFFPYELLEPLQAVPPVKGTTWKANFCRLDYDAGKMIKWSWAPVKEHFHEFMQFQTLLFE